MELGLRKPASAPDTPASPLSPDIPLAPFVDRLMALLSSLAPEGAGQETEEFRRQIQDYRAAVTNPMRRMELPRVIEACIATCQAYFLRYQNYHREREAEFREIISILQEAAKITIGDSSEFNARLIESSERFGRLAQLDDMRELKRRLSSEVAMLRQTVEEKQKRDEVAYTQLTRRVESLQARLTEVEAEAVLDALTRVANRHGFQRTLARLMAQAQSRHMPLSLAMVDVDDFKRINDTHGHPIGDRVLLCTAQWLTRGLRQTDFVARYGGEEFAVLLAGVTVAQIEDRLRQIVEAIAGSSYEYELLGEKERVNFTISCGLTELQAGDTEDTLIQRADDALYEAKRKGKNRLVVRRRSSLKTLLSWG